MARSGTISLDWGDGTHSFRLRIGELMELQEKCDAGPAFILERLATGKWKVQDVRETIRLGLLGGEPKTEAVKTLALVKRYVDERPLAENVQFAYAIIAAAVVGAEDEPLGKSEEAPEAAQNLSQEESSDSLPSTPLEQ